MSAQGITLRRGWFLFRISHNGKDTLFPAPICSGISQTKANLIHLLMLIMNIDNIMSVEGCVYSGVQNSIDNFVLCRALSEPHCPKCNRETKYKLKGFMSSGA